MVITEDVSIEQKLRKIAQTGAVARRLQQEEEVCRAAVVQAVEEWRKVTSRRGVAWREYVTATREVFKLLADIQRITEPDDRDEDRTYGVQNAFGDQVSRAVAQCERAIEAMNEVGDG